MRSLEYVSGPDAPAFCIGIHAQPCTERPCQQARRNDGKRPRGIRAIGQASAEGTLEMLGKCRGVRKARQFMLGEMVELGYKGGKVRIGHCQNAALALELCTEIQQRFPEADVRSYPLRGLCSYYAERGGIMLGFES